VAPWPIRSHALGLMLEDIFDNRNSLLDVEKAIYIVLGK
jgi:hypothetical protein